MNFPSRKWLRSIVLDLRGAALIEFAIAAPLLAVMLLGVVDYSLKISATLAVDRAVRTGADRAVVSGFDETAISSAITSAISNGEISGLTALAANPAPTSWCGCPDAQVGITAAACGSTCSSGRDAGTYVTANGQATFTHLFTWPGQVSSTDTISSTTTVRIP